MGITNNALTEIAGIIGGSGTVPSHTAIGSGNTAFATSDTELDNETDRNIFTSTTIAGSQVTFTSDYSATEVSGLSLREFGIFNALTTGDLFSREVLTGSQVFSGDTELQIQNVFRFSN